MLVFNCTKAAAEFFTVTKKGKKYSAVEDAPEKVIPVFNDQSQWHWLVHAVKVKGKHVLVVMDCRTRFSMTLTGFKKGDDMAFVNLFEHHLTFHAQEMMASAKVDAQIIRASLDHYRKKHDRVAFYLRGDRSVQTHLNDVVWHFRGCADQRGEVPAEVDLISFDEFANQLLRKSRLLNNGYIKPSHEGLREWLKNYGEYNADQADACIDDLCAELRAESRAEFAANHPELVAQEVEPCLVREDAKLSNNVISLDDFRKK